MRVRMEVPALRVPMPQRDLGPNRYIRVRIRHMPSPKRMLELAAHEPVPVSGILEYGEMDAEHHHVEDHRDRNKADGTRDEVPYP